MSGKPTHEGVAAALAMIERLSALDEEIDRLRPLANRMKEAASERDSVATDLSELLRRMDLSAQGNCGFGDRMSWFLRVMHRSMKGALALALTLSLTACGGPEFAWRDRCDVDRQERVFLECLRAAQHMGGPAAPGNDSDEVIDSCGAEARAVACVRAFECVDRCSEAAP